MLDSTQKQTVIQLALEAIRLQKGLVFAHTDFDLYLDKPNTSSIASIYIFSKITNDNFKIRLYLTEFSNYSGVGTIIGTVEENYSHGLNGNIYIAECKLERESFRSFYHYLKSPEYLADIVTPLNKILLEDGTGAMLVEQGIGYLIQEN